MKTFTVNGKSKNGKYNITLDQGVEYSVLVTATNAQNKVSDKVEFKYTLETQPEGAGNLKTIIAVMVGIIIGKYYN